MHISPYNNTLHVMNKHTILYNSMHNSIIILKNHLLDPDFSLSNLRFKEDENLYAKLVKGGFIIENIEDEIETLKNKVSESLTNNNEFILHINPTLDCNVKCWYCYENHVKGSKLNSTVANSIKRLIERITRNSEIKTLEIGFFGGEPLMHFNEISKGLIKSINDVCLNRGVKIKVHFTTNGTLLNDTIISFLKRYDSAFQITLDGVSNTHNKTRFLENGKGTFDLIISNIIKLAKNSLKTIVRVNYTKANVHSIMEIESYLSSLPKEAKGFIFFDFQRVWQERTNEEDETERKMCDIRDKYRAMGYNVLVNYLHKDVKYPCYGDKMNYLMINYNGEIFGCTARDFKSSNRLGQIHSDGTVAYDFGKYETWSALKFRKKICHTCRIAPICGGGCKQRAYEVPEENVCTLHYSEVDKDKRVLDIIDFILTNKAYSHDDIISKN